VLECSRTFSTLRFCAHRALSRNKNRPTGKYVGFNGRLSYSVSKHIGLFGGSFDPLHLGHEALVRVALERLELDEVWVIPVGEPVHRKLSGQADASTRLAWAEAVFSDVAGVVVKDWEVAQNRPVAAIDTLKQFREQYPDVMPLWLCGADSFATMESWVGYPEHQQWCSVAVFSRIGQPAIEPFAGWKTIAVEQWCSGGYGQAGLMVSLDGSLPNISATDIRNRARRGKGLEGLVNRRICEEVTALYGSVSGEVN